MGWCAWILSPKMTVSAHPRLEATGSLSRTLWVSGGGVRTRWCRTTREKLGVRSSVSRICIHGCPKMTSGADSLLFSISKWVTEIRCRSHRSTASSELSRGTAEQVEDHCLLGADEVRAMFGSSFVYIEYRSRQDKLQARYGLLKPTRGRRRETSASLRHGCS